jgi:hypothetical protein
MTCRVCGHKKRLEIDRALLEGQSLRDIAKRTSLTPSSLQRHKAEHLTRSLVKAHEAREVARADSLLAEVFRQEALFDELDQTAKAIQESAAGEQDRRGVLDAIGVRGSLAHKRRPYMELRGRMTGELLDSHASLTAAQIVVNVLQIPRIREAPEAIEGSVTPAALPPATLKG